LKGGVDKNGERMKGREEGTRKRIEEKKYKRAARVGELWTFERKGEGKRNRKRGL
jgi:hypothetical protein